MKNVRHIVLLSLVVLLLASCVGLPPVFPERTRSPQSEEPAGVVATAEPPTEVPAGAEQPAPPAVAETAVVTATTAIAATSIVSPTGVVTTTVPVEAAATPTEEQVMGANPLVGTVWEWAALLKTSPAAQSVVPDPASYILIFGEDGKALVKADCNDATATYTLSNDQLVITVGGVTKAACPPGSLGDLMLTSLSNVASYLIDGGDLVLRLGGGGDSMLFRNGGPSAVPAPPPPVTQAPAATEAPAAAAPAPQTPTPSPVTGAESTKLVGPVWQWQRFVDVATGKNTMDVKNPEKYTATFKDNGSVDMKADCNQAAGTYTVDGSKLTIAVGPVTLAACGAGSLGEEFLIGLTSAASYSIENGQLNVDLMADGGRMIFGAAK